MKESDTGRNREEGQTEMRLGATALSEGAPSRDLPHTLPVPGHCVFLLLLTP